jgi:fused signal recognition particle receptor
VLLVLDATLGQNGLAQAREFQKAVNVTSLALTKLDGTARGGAVLAIVEQLQLPVSVVGLGEGLGDWEPFDPEAFARGLFEDD